MNEKWFWKHRGELRGPIDTEDLASLVRQRRVFDRDQLRLDGESEWIAGRHVKEMFSGKKSSPAEKSTSISQKRPIADEGSRRGFEFSLPAISLGGVFDFFADRIAFLLVPLVYVLAFFCNRRVILASIFIVLIAVVGFRAWQSHQLYNGAFQELLSVWDDMENLRVTNAAPTEWTALQKAALPRLDPLIKTLQADAKVLSPGPHDVGTAAWKKDFTSRKLLSASQTLREVLYQLPKYDLEKTNFVREMDSARDLLTGAELRVITEAPQRRPLANEPSLSWASMASPMTICIIIVDTLLVAGGAVWYWNRRR